MEHFRMNKFSFFSKKILFMLFRLCTNTHNSSNSREWYMRCEHYFRVVYNKCHVLHIHAEICLEFAFVHSHALCVSLCAFITLT